MELFNGTISQLIEEISNLPVNDSLVKFAGEKSLKSITTKLNNGCPELTAKYNALPCDFVLKTSTPSYVLADEGLFFDVATFVSGEPECWFTECHNGEHKPEKDFYINATFHHKVTEKTIFEKLIQIVQIIDSLEANGQRLNIYVCCYSISKTGKKTSALICKIKDSSEPVDIDQLIYLCASPAILRYCFLRLEKQAYGEKYVSYTDTAIEEDLLQNTDFIYIPSFVTDQRKYYITEYKNTDLKTVYNINY